LYSKVGDMMKGLKKANNTLQEFSDLVESKQVSSHNRKNLRVGIDLGTSSIVLSVVNDKGKPIYGAFEYNESIRDGLVVDYVGAVTITRALKAKAEAALGTELVYAAAAVPPGTIGKNKDVVGHVLESAGFEVTCILDEPTTGLHFQDIKKLLEVLNRLLEKGNTVIIIEHNLDVIKTADHIIDIGVDGGENGGTVVATGTPEEIAKSKKSYTGKYIAKILKKKK